MVAYMNTSGRVKALAGRTGGSVCTSSNAHHVMQCASRTRRSSSCPTSTSGRTAGARSASRPKMFTWPEAGLEAASDRRHGPQSALASMRQSWCCGAPGAVSIRSLSLAMWVVEGEGVQVLVHPECTHEVVKVADGSGSTNYLWGELMSAEPGAKFAVGTEAHFVENARQQLAARGVEVVNLADVTDPEFPSMGCGCATMSRNAPPHLVATLDLLRQGRAPEINRVESGDVVEADTGWRERLNSIRNRSAGATERPLEDDRATGPLRRLGALT